jgi:hypothetical protein
MFSVRILLMALSTGWCNLVKAKLLFGFSFVYTKRNCGSVAGWQREKVLWTETGIIQILQEVV